MVQTDFRVNNLSLNCQSRVFLIQINDFKYIHNNEDLLRIIVVLTSYRELAHYSYAHHMNHYFYLLILLYNLSN